MCHHCELADAKPAKPAKGKAKPATRKAKGKAKPTPRSAKVPAAPSTHEAYVQAIYALAAALPTITEQDRATIRAIKLAYGAGPSGARGVTYFNRWTMPSGSTGHLVAICATAQESAVQICGTTLHELGHVLAGPLAGHGADWFAACARLGLGDTERGCARIEAAGTAYTWEMFEPGIRAALQALPLPTDGQPVAPNYAAGQSPLPGQPAPRTAPRPCGMGIGTRGGTSRGTGAGSRYIKYTCQCAKPVVIRHAGLDLAAKCLKCNSNFTHDPDSIPAASTNGTGKLAPGAIKRAKPSKARKGKAKPAALKAAAKAQAPLPAKPAKGRAKQPGPANPNDPDVPF